MTVTQVIEFFERIRREQGDVELWHECDDGHSTWGEPWTPQHRFKKIWEGHSQPRQHYIR